MGRAPARVVAHRRVQRMQMAAQQIKQLLPIEIVRAFVPRKPLLQLRHNGFEHYLRTDGEDRPLALCKPLRPANQRSACIQQVGNDEKKHFAVAAREIDRPPPEPAMLTVVGRVDLARIEQRQGNVRTLAQARERRRLLKALRVAMRRVNRVDDLVSGCEVWNISSTQKIAEPHANECIDVLLAPDSGDQSNSHLSFPGLRAVVLLD
jgi:hypothetical protein